MAAYKILFLSIRALFFLILGFNSGICLASDINEHYSFLPYAEDDSKDKESSPKVKKDELYSHIPEPMVFDLVRPLGARKGELEINTLGLFPLRNRGRSRSVRDVPDALEDTDETRIDWAPEIEYALFDDFAVELELPFEDEKLVAYKFAAQWTLGSAMDGKMIHGTQGITEYNRFSKVTEFTFLYINGFVFSPEWSLLSMAGIRGESGGNVDRGPLEIIVNSTLFYSFDEDLFLGLEVDTASSVSEGENSVLIMPQIGLSLNDNWSFQTGIGAQISDERFLPILGARLVWSM